MSTTGPAGGVDLVDEHNGARHLAGLAEQLADTLRTDPDDHLDELRRAGREERHAGLAGGGPGQHGLAGAGRAGQQDALGRPGAEAVVPVRVAKESTTSDTSATTSSMPVKDGIEPIERRGSRCATAITATRDPSPARHNCSIGADRLLDARRTVAQQHERTGP
jgi:hypothetical protein